MHGGGGGGSSSVMSNGTLCGSNLPAGGGTSASQPGSNGTASSGAPPQQYHHQSSSHNQSQQSLPSLPPLSSSISASSAAIGGGEGSHAAAAAPVTSSNNVTAQRQVLPPPHPLQSAAQYSSTYPLNAGNEHQQHSSYQEYPQQQQRHNPHRRQGSIGGQAAFASSSPRLPSIQQHQQQQFHQQQQGGQSNSRPSEASSTGNMPKSTLPYQYGASNYALPQPQQQQQQQGSSASNYQYQQPQQSQQQPQQQHVPSSYSSYHTQHHHQQPTHIPGQSSQMQSGNTGNVPHYTYQPTFPVPPLASAHQLPLPHAPQSHTYQSQSQSQSTAPSSMRTSSDTSHSHSGGSSSTRSSILLPNVPKTLNSPTRIQDSIQADSQSAALESLKFPFLLPKKERSGRRGLFSLKSIMKPEDVEEIGPPLPSSASASVNATSGSSASGNDLSHEALLATDPIQAGVISLEDARTLFKLYMDEMSVLNCLLDPTIHTHDFVRNRSKFLYTAILSVISRYLNSTTYTTDGQPRRLISPVYTYCKKAARAHLKEVLGNVECSLEVIQGLAVLTFHKEPEDEKACLHLYRVSRPLIFFKISAPVIHC